MKLRYLFKKQMTADGRIGFISKQSMVQLNSSNSRSCYHGKTDEASWYVL